MAKAAVLTGPKGGKYYIGPSGKKIYGTPHEQLAQAFPHHAETIKKIDPFVAELYATKSTSHAAVDKALHEDAKFHGTTAKAPHIQETPKPVPVVKPPVVKKVPATPKPAPPAPKPLAALELTQSVPTVIEKSVSAPVAAPSVPSKPPALHNVSAGVLAKQASATVSDAHLGLEHPDLTKAKAWTDKWDVKQPHLLEKAHGSLINKLAQKADQNDHDAAKDLMHLYNVPMIDLAKEAGLLHVKWGTKPEGAAPRSVLGAVDGKVAKVVEKFPVVRTLKEALNPISDAESGVVAVVTSRSQLGKTLTASQAAAIRHFSNGMDSDVRAVQHGVSPSMLDDGRKAVAVAALLETLHVGAGKTIPNPPGSVTAYRGIHGLDAETFHALATVDTFAHKATSSASTSFSVANSFMEGSTRERPFSVMFVHRDLKKGAIAAAAYVHPDVAGEDEFMIHGKEKFKVTNREIMRDPVHSNGLTLIMHLEHADD